jgi:PAS domain S-box-containing protein
MSTEKQRTILLVDDEAIIAMAEKATLENYGYAVIIAGSGEDAVAAVVKAPAIDLILMDINLGAGLDGTEAAAAILKDRDLPVVFLSSHTEPDVVAKTEKITSYGYVVKNSSATVLDASIKMAFKLFEAKIHKNEKEAALHESEEWNRLILSTVLSGVMVVDAATRKIVEVNDTGLKMIGLPKEQVVGSVCHRFVCPAEERNCPVLDIGNQVDLSEKILLAAKGERKSIIKTVVPVIRHGHQYLVESFVDISGRKQAEKELKKRNQYIESILGNMPIGFAVNTIDDGVARYMNDNFSKIYGWPKEVLIDVSQFFEKVCPGVEGEELKTRVMRDMGSGDPERMAWNDLKITTSTGEHRYISARNIPIPEQNLMVSTVWDTTQAYKSQEALRDSEERYRSVLNASPDSIAITDMEGRIIMISPATLTMFGIEREEDILGLFFPNFVAPADRERAMSDVALMSQGTMTGLGEYKGLRPDGSVVDLEVNGEFISDANGQPQQMLFIIRDIADRKRAEALYRLLFEQSSDGIVIIDPATARILEFNETAHRQLGYSREEFAGLSIADIEDLETAEEIQGRISRVMHEGASDFETRQRTRLGEIRDIRVIAQFTKMLGRPIYHCIWRDITELKRAASQREAALGPLQESEERLRDILFSMADWVWEVDKEGIYTYSSEKGEALLGYSRKDIIGKTPLDFMPADEAKRVGAIFSEIIANKAPIKDLENWNSGKNGERICILTNGVPMLDKEGNLKGYRGVDSNITGRKRAESQKEAALAALRKSEERFHSLFDNMAEGVALHELVMENGKPVNYRIIDVNDRFLKIIGVTREQVIGRLATEAYGTATPAYFAEFAGVALGKKPVSFETYFASMGKHFAISVVPWQESGFATIFTDISERRRAEETIKNALRFQQALLDAVPSPIFYKDANLVYTGGNKAFERYIRLTSEQFIGKTVYDISPADLAKKYEQADRELLTNRRVQTYEASVLNTDGTRHDVVFNKAVFTDAEGNVAGLIGVILDISERKRAEAALQENNSRLELAMQAADMAWWEMDLPSGHVTFEKRKTEMLGYPAEKFKHYQDFVALVHPDDREKAMAAMRGHLDGSLARYEVDYRIASSSGEYLWFHDIGSVGKRDAGGRPQNVTGLVINVSERKRAEEALRTSEAKQSNALQMTKAGHWEYDVDGDLFTFNDNFYRIFRTTAAAVGGYQMSAAEYARRFCYPDDMAMVGIETQGAIESPDPHYSRQIEHRILYADGEVGTIAVRFFIAKDPQGRTVTTYGVNQDISDRKRAEEEIKRQLAEKGMLLKEAHHRIKNNIASISGLLSLHMQTITSPEAIAALQEAIGRVDSIRILYDKLLLGGDFQDVSVKNYVESLAASVVSLFPDQTKVKLDARVDDFNLDPKRLFPLGIIINELLTNIMKYAFAKKKSGHIQLSLAKAGSRVTLVIQDNGVGLPGGFDVEGAKGFGLTLVKMLSQQLGGSFSIEKHKGTRCTVIFDV